MSLAELQPIGAVARSLTKYKRSLIWIFIFSGVVNILGLSGSIYMLLVYDRVLTSRSVHSLLALSLLAIGLFALMGMLDIVRAQVVSRIGTLIERELLEPVHKLVVRFAQLGRKSMEATQPIRDLEALRAFLGGHSALAFLDLPWMPLYLILVFVLHPLLGWISLAGMSVMIVLTLASDLKVRSPAQLAAQATARRNQIAESTRRNIEVLRAMGFENVAARRFHEASEEMFHANQKASDIGNILGLSSKTFRAALQSVILGVGAYLVLQNQMSAGGMIASSILTARALAPVELAIAHWRGFVAARDAYKRLEQRIAALGQPVQRAQLPPPRTSVIVDNLTVAAPGTQVPIVRRVALQLKAGDGLALIGPSGAGKSSLARAMVGAWPALVGSVRLDGAPLLQWPEEALGRMIGYLPQEVELFEGTIAENIARLDPNAEDEAIIKAAQAAQVHSMILNLPQGYATVVGEGGHNLSVGQRQRVGLARAMYGDPFFVVLDEPNAHLDDEGERALAAAIRSIRERGGVVVVVSHRVSILESLNLVALVLGGELKGFGSKEQFFKSQAAAALAAQKGSLEDGRAKS